MDDISTLKDYYISDLIGHIQTMPRQELERKLIEIESQKIEKMTDEEILRFNEIKNE